MIRLNIHDAKTHLSAYLTRIERGESILLCKRNIPVAEIRPLPKTRQAPRPLGLLRGAFTIPDAYLRPFRGELQ